MLSESCKSVSSLRTEEALAKKVTLKGLVSQTVFCALTDHLILLLNLLYFR